MQRILSFAAGALCGALFGSVTALLFTPVSSHDIKAQSQLGVERIRNEMRLAYEQKQAELEAHLAALKSQGLSNPE